MPHSALMPVRVRRLGPSRSLRIISSADPSLTSFFPVTPHCPISSLSDHKHVTFRLSYLLIRSRHRHDHTCEATITEPIPILPLRTSTEPSDPLYPLSSFDTSRQPESSPIPSNIHDSAEVGLDRGLHHRSRRSHRVREERDDIKADDDHARGEG